MPNRSKQKRIFFIILTVYFQQFGGIVENTRNGLDIVTGEIGLDL